MIEEPLPSIDELLISARQPLHAAIRIIDKNAQGVCFVVNEKGTLVGVLTDGDIRRQLLKGASLETPVEAVMKKNFTSLPATTPVEVIQRKITQTIRHIPLVDSENRPIDYACLHRFRRFQVAQPLLVGNELAYVTDCIRSNWVSSQGGYVRRFEQMFTEYCRVPHALAVSNGTVALHLALDALGIGEGDEVIVPNFTFAATINAVLYARATPVLVDVHPDTWTIDPEAIQRAITTRTKAVIPVHIYGHPCHMDEIAGLARKHKLFVIEDCAEALGSLYKGAPVGSFGDAATFSFYGNKTITTGEGGMVLFKSGEFGEKAEILRDHGMSKERRYWHEAIGYNYRLTNLQAAVGVAQMERIDEIIEAKVTLGETYREHLTGIEAIQLPPNQLWAKNTYWLYTVSVRENGRINRDELMNKLIVNGIETRPVFFPLHVMPLYQRYAANSKFPVSEKISSQGFSLPSAVSLTTDDIRSICKSVHSILNVRDFIGGFATSARSQSSHRRP